MLHCISNIASKRAGLLLFHCSSIPLLFKFKELGAWPVKPLFPINWFQYLIYRVSILKIYLAANKASSP